MSPVSPITRAEGDAVSAGFRLPVKTQLKGGAEWVAKDQVTQAIASIESVTGDRGRRADSRSDVKPDTKTDQGGKAEAEEKTDRVKLSAGPPDQGGRADVDDKPERVKLPIGAPSTPVVPSDAVQGKGKGKGKNG
jgi:hypothetical protein